MSSSIIFIHRKHQQQQQQQHQRWKYKTMTTKFKSNFIMLMSLLWLSCNCYPCVTIFGHVAAFSLGNLGIKKHNTHRSIGIIINPNLYPSGNLFHASILPSTSTSLNGVSGFRTWFASRFPDALIPIDNDHDGSNSVIDPVSTSTSASTSTSTSTSTATFSHVLIDANQILHVALRRSSGDEDRALFFLLYELDNIVKSTAQPTKSIVLAFDGSAPAAKISTQRRRRYDTVAAVQRRKKRFEFVQRNVNSKESNKGIIGDMKTWKIKQSKWNKKRSNRNEEKMLCITPGTVFMDRAYDAVLYWAWQRLGSKGVQLSSSSHKRYNHRNNNNKHLSGDVRCYISPSSVPGEGEVKLLDWLLLQGQQGKDDKKNTNTNMVKPGDSVAIMR